jgi:hypothetical protein
MEQNKDIIKYDITGIDRYGKRFSMTYNNINMALGINLWCGSVWEVTNGKRKLIKRVSN